MLVSFNNRNEVESIRVGAATFATGGGDLWTAWFSSPAIKAAATAEATRDGAVDAAVPNWPIEESITDRMLLRVGSSEATSFRSTETEAETILFYGGIALGGELQRDRQFARIWYNICWRLYAKSKNQG